MKERTGGDFVGRLRTTRQKTNAENVMRGQKVVPLPMELLQDFATRALRSNRSLVPRTSPHGLWPVQAQAGGRPPAWACTGQRPCGLVLGTSDRFDRNALVAKSCNNSIGSGTTFCPLITFSAFVFCRVVRKRPTKSPPVRSFKVTRNFQVFCSALGAFRPLPLPPRARCAWRGCSC